MQPIVEKVKAAVTTCGSHVPPKCRDKRLFCGREYCSASSAPLTSGISDAELTQAKAEAPPPAPVSPAKPASKPEGTEPAPEPSASTTGAGAAASSGAAAPKPAETASAGAGGALETLKKTKPTWNKAFFGGAVVTVLAGMLGAIELHGEFLALIFQFLLIAIGLALVVMDFPMKEHPQVKPARGAIFEKGGSHPIASKYFHFLTRLTGRGGVYIVLGGMVFLSTHTATPIIGFLFGGGLVVLGFATVAYGIKQSMRLENVRKAMAQRGRDAETGALCPPSGMTAHQFGVFAKEMCGETFTDEEMVFALHALSSGAKAEPKITKDEFVAWVKMDHAALM